jgi:hypothetical protein
MGQILNGKGTFNAAHKLPVAIWQAMSFLHFHAAGRDTSSGVTCVLWILVVLESGRKVVAMVEAAKPGHRDHFAASVGFCCDSATWSLLLQTQMCSVVVIVADVFGEKALEMMFVEHDDMIEQVPSAVTDKAFSDPILPRAAEAGSLWLNAEALDSADGFFVEVGPAIEDQILGRRVVGKRFTELLCHPGARRMLRHTEVQDTAAVMR